jgi:hypothetical protein
MITAGEELRACRRANRANEEALQRDAVARQRVDVRRAKLRVAVDAEVAPTLVICQKNDDVRPRLGSVNARRYG